MHVRLVALNGVTEAESPVEAAGEYAVSASSPGPFVVEVIRRDPWFSAVPIAWAGGTSLFDAARVDLSRQSPLDIDIADTTFQGTVEGIVLPSRSGSRIALIDSFGRNQLATAVYGTGLGMEAIPAGEYQAELTPYVTDGFASSGTNAEAFRRSLRRPALVQTVTLPGGSVAFQVPPPASVTVSATPDQELVYPQVEVSTDDGFRLARLPLDATNQLTFVNLPPGPTVFKFTAEGAADRWYRTGTDRASAQVLELKSGDEITLDPVELSATSEPPPPGTPEEKVISGRMSYGGQPLAQQTVELDSHVGYSKSTTTDANGRYEFVLLEPASGWGRYVVSASADGVPLWSPAARAESEATVIDLASASSPVTADIDYSTFASQVEAGSLAIAGGAVVDQRLRAVTSDWAPTLTKLSFQWLRDDVVIDAATSSDYVLVAADVGSRLSVSVTGKSPGYRPATVVSSATTRAAKASFAAHPPPRIAGVVRVGATMKAVSDPWTPKAGFTYRWYRDGVSIPEATKATYTASRADKNRSVSVRTTGSRDGYGTVRETSAARQVR